MIIIKLHQTTAYVGSLRLAQKINKKVGDIIKESRNDQEVIEHSIKLLGAAGTIYLSGKISISKPIELPYPSYFNFIGGTLQAWGSSIILFKKKDKPSKHAIIQIEHTKLRGKKNNPPLLDLEGVYHVLTHSVDGTGCKKIFSLKNCNGGMKLVEFSYAMSIDEVPFDMNSDFTTIINPEGFSGNPKYLFGPGGMLIGGHTGTQGGGVKTYQLPENIRIFYPTMIIGGSPEGYDPVWIADGAYLVLLGTSKGGGAKKGYLELNGGKVVFIGEDWDK